MTIAFQVLMGKEIKWQVQVSEHLEIKCISALYERSDFIEVTIIECGCVDNTTFTTSYAAH